MAFDKSTRNRLASFVSKARNLLADEFRQQFQSLYGISDKGIITPLEQLGHLDDAGLGTAMLLRERIDYLVRSHPEDKDGTQGAVDRLAREQAFTVLNRLAAVRMAEKRDLVVESVGKGYQSKGFQVFEKVAGSGLGETYQRYCRYLFCLFDELAVDLGVLFDRRSPQGLLFPRESALQELLKLLNAPDLEALWVEDETIGWIYQYYNDPAERKKMHKSPAPRNSRELAVRNQFFTPRYVVEFLTDNTLGRIWYEMTQGQTQLKDQCCYLVRHPTEIFLNPGDTAPDTPPQNGLSQEELLRQPVYITHRPLKDPRDILLLDPACGSMHFGLYAYDLFETIYDEAWELEEQLGVAALSRPPGIKPLHDTYNDKDTFLKDVPRLIIEHNLHGIDIDPRAVQIAGLSLWLRAQRTWQQQGLRLQNRPRIRRSNIVCAEPMPGDEAFLEEFIATHLSTTPEGNLLGQLVRHVFDAMKLAAEAGSLLKIEEEIAGAVTKAKERWLEWIAGPKMEQGRLFTDNMQQSEQLELHLDVTGITDETFWEEAEERIYAALQAYAEQAELSGSYQRRLFADDAARGFAFIDLCRKRYDVVLMNPPYGQTTLDSQPALKRYPKGTPANLYALFMIRAANIISSQGAFGCISDSTFLKQPTFLSTRHLLLSDTAPLNALIDLGWGVLDANVRTALTVVSKPRMESFWGLDISDRDDRASLLRDAVLGSKLALKKRADWLRLPKSVFALNISADASRQLVEMQSLGVICSLPWGCGANDAFRLFRLRWEVSASDVGVFWTFLTNGGSFSPFYRENYLVCRSKVENGESAFSMEFREGTDTLYDASAQELYFLPGLTYPKRSALFHVSILPKGHVFTPEGKGLFLQDSSAIWLNLGLLNSTFVASIAGIVCGPHKQRGDVELIKIPRIEGAVGRMIAESARLIFESGRAVRQSEECSTWFLVPGAPYLIVKNARSIREIIDTQALSISTENLRACESMEQIDQAVSRAVPDELLTFCDNDELTTERNAIWKDLVLGADALVSHLTGTAFGLWDIRCATGEKSKPELPDPFASLPVCPPGQLQNEQGLPLTKEDVERLKKEGRWIYPIEIPWDGILVDDPVHPLDIETRIHQVLQAIWKDLWEAIEHEACEILGVKSLRDYFRKSTGFFADHLKRYSKSRRQAPIYWPLSTASGSYTLWLYYHRLTDNTFHIALADFIDPKLRSVRVEISSIRESGTHRDRLEELLDLEKELEDFRAEIEHIIKLPWKPNLNDGVLITASPLWKLFRLPKWQKSLKACWENLEKGDYDWAHLAYSIWPTRVEEVCKTDRSIAIAHGLEHLCIVEAPKPKAKRRKKSAQTVLEGMEP